MASSIHILCFSVDKLLDLLPVIITVDFLRNHVYNFDWQEVFLRNLSGPVLWINLYDIWNRSDLL